MIAIASKKFRECIGLNCAEINLQHLGTFAFPVHYCSITGDPSLPSKAAGDTIRKGLHSKKGGGLSFAQMYLGMRSVHNLLRKSSLRDAKVSSAQIDIWHIRG